MKEPTDPRHISCGREIPTENYCDQPYVVQTDDGAWLCVLTTGGGHEGQPGQHVVTLRSTDLGQTWSEPVALEPADGPEASYAVLLKVPYGRIYCFYNHNTDNLRDVIADDPPFKDGVCRRVDSLGHFVLKFSDDHGRTWSEQRYDVPIREMAIDRENPYQGRVRFFWNVGKPFVHRERAYVSVHKVGGFGEGFFTRSEGVLVSSANILTESNPSLIRWVTLPDGDCGLRTPPGGGAIAEEQSYSVLTDGSFYCVYRTIDRHPACCYSRDQGHTWTVPRYKRYADGRLLKHPRAANFAWKCGNGNFLYWFHNHGGNWYDDRNPVWISGGVEAEGPDGRVIQWSQPEILLYDDDPFVRMSYPDLIEQDGRTYLTETQKDKARVHEIDPGLLAGLWDRFDSPSVAREGLVLELPAGQGMSEAVAVPRLPAFCTRDATRADCGTRDLGQGFSIALWLRFQALTPGQVILDSRTENGHGLCLRTSDRRTIEIVLNDGRTENRWESDTNPLTLGDPHHVVATVDGGPKVITFVIDGSLCDGGADRQFGWGRFSPHLRDVNGSSVLRLAPRLRGELLSLRLYDRYLRTAEAAGNYRAGAPATRATG